MQTRDGYPTVREIVRHGRGARAPAALPMPALPAVASPVTRPTTPGDATQVLATFRFAWAVAEMRGRYRPDVRHVSHPPKATRVGHALPLADERSEREQEIELHRLIAALSTKLRLGWDVAVPGRPGLERDAASQLRDLGRAMADALKRCDADKARPGEVGLVWRDITQVLYLWDKRIQDHLALAPAQGAAYQLGRALAETYWMLDPVAPDDAWTAWGFVLGARRRERIQQLLARLTPYIDPLVPVAIGASLDAWGELAADPARRGQPGARERLYHQGVLWRELVRGEMRPGDLTPPRGEVVRMPILRPLVSTFRIELLLGAAALVVFTAAATLLATGATSEWAGTVALILSSAGITATSVFTKAKASANSLAAQLRESVASERAAQAATVLPAATDHSPRASDRRGSLPVRGTRGGVRA